MKRFGFICRVAMRITRTVIEVTAILLLVHTGADAQGTPLPHKRLDLITQGMTPAQVRAILGEPLRTRRDGGLTYLYFANGCEGCTGDDYVVVRDCRVVGARFDNPNRYVVRSEPVDPTPPPAAECALAAGEPGRAVTIPLVGDSLRRAPVERPADANPASAQPPLSVDTPSHSVAQAELLAAIYERIGKAHLARVQSDSALMYFGAAEIIRNPRRITELGNLLQSSPLNDLSRSEAERSTYEQHARRILARVVPADAFPGIPSNSVEEVEDALEMMLPPNEIKVVVTSVPSGLHVRYRITRSNPQYRPGPYAPITTDTTIIRERARFQFCYLDPTGESRMIIVPCQTGCTVRLPVPIQWTRACEDRQ